MVRYITTHGQVEPNTQALTALGKEQASLLGAHLRAQEFCGRILCAEGAALETAQIIAEVTGAQIVSFAAFNISAEGELHQRVMMGYRRVLAEYPCEALLFVVHRECAEELINIFIKKRKLNARQYDCALSAVYPTKYITPVLYDTSFLPYAKTTLGGKTREECDSGYWQEDFKKEVRVPDLSDLSGERVLHIGDTESFAYPYYRKLFETVRPDVILHTGDIADEVKIGRDPSLLYEYTVKSKVILDMMKETGARIVIVIGNHDVAEVIRELAPYAEVYEPGSEVVISGEACRLGHQVKTMTFDRKYCMYGHGMAGEDWRNDLNLPGESCRFNVAFGSYVYDLKNGKFVCMPRIFNDYLEI